MLCNALNVLERQGHAVKVVDFSAQSCIDEYNAPRPADLHFQSVALVHRQLPGLTAQAWWSDDRIPSAIMSIKHHIPRIQEEVQQVVSQQTFQGWEVGDEALTTNANWDSRTSWDLIVLYGRGHWVSKGCQLFPITCKILQDEGTDLEMLFNASLYSELVPEAVRVDQGYSVGTTLGAKLYRVWPGAGLKPHTGHPGRVVNSVALQAPVNSTITVGAETRSWVTGVM